MGSQKPPTPSKHRLEWGGKILGHHSLVTQEGQGMVVVGITNFLEIPRARKVAR